MRLSSLAIAASSVVPLFAGCAETPRLSETEVVDGVVDDVVDDTDRLPSTATSWHCVGPVSDDGHQTVLRVVLDLQTSMATTTRGPQFARHGLSELDPDTAPPQTTHALRPDVDGGFVADGFALTLTTSTQPGLATAVVDGVAGFDCVDGDTLFATLPARYVEGRGCIDSAGAAARNDIPVAIVRELGFAVCVDVDGPLNASDFGYPVFKDWDLRGANLNGSGLFFANLIDAQLEGAVLDAFPFGYAEVTGSIDDATVPPEACTIDDDRLACRQ